MNIKDFEQKMKSNGYKMTPQRKAILEVLVKHNGHFVSAEKIYEEANNIHSNLNITTVYRNLEILESINIIHKIRIDEGISLYDIISTDAHHHHIICKNCGKTEVIDFCPLQDLIDLAEKKDFTLTEHKMELYGYCEKCRKK